MGVHIVIYRGGSYGEALDWEQVEAAIGRVGQDTGRSPCSHSYSTFVQVLLRKLNLTATRTRILSCL